MQPAFHHALLLVALGSLRRSPLGSPVLRPELTSAIALVMTTMLTTSEADSCSPPIAHPINTATAGLT